MKRFKKIISLILAAAILCIAPLPHPAQAARPRTFNNNLFLHVSNSMKTVWIGIQGMKFAGKLKPGYTDEELDKLIDEVLSELGLTADDFDRLNEPGRPLTQQEINDIRDALVTAAGLTGAVGVPAVGELAQIAKLIDQLRQGDYTGAAWTLFDNYMLGLSGVNPVAFVIYGHRLSREIRHLLEQIWRHAAGTAGPVYEFYRRLKKRLDDLDTDWVLSVENWTSVWKPIFLFFGTGCYEKWTMNMLLKQREEYGNYGFEGTYDGSYTITIEYDLSNFQSSLGDRIWSLGEIGQSLNTLTNTSELWSQYNYNYNQGTCDVKRTLTGEATAFVPGPLAFLASPRITPNQKSDERDVNFSGNIFNFEWKMSYSGEGVVWNVDLSWTMELKADENGLIGDLYDGHGVSTNNMQSGSTPFSENPFTVNTPWDPKIWERGDKASQGWTLSFSY